MSGFAAIVSLDGSPRDPSLIAGVRRTLLLRGSQGDAIWEDQGITLLHTGLAAGGEAVLPPCELEGRVVVFDGRLDGREDLARELRSRGHEAVA